jgi:hypothetical protein
MFIDSLNQVIDEYVAADPTVNPTVVEPPPCMSFQCKWTIEWDLKCDEELERLPLGGFAYTQIHRQRVET